MNAKSQTNSTPASDANSGEKFEEKVRKMIETERPFCTLSNVILFRPRSAWFTAARQRPNELGDHGFELDHLLHAVDEKKNEIIIVECKDPRVAQSDLLGLLRLGMPVTELGHPELPNAIAYIEHCRRELDTELYREFEPTTERWAIDGLAGMGKSVLLAYSLLVFATDQRLDRGGKLFRSFEEEAKKLGLPELGQRQVYAFALREKQRRVIENHYQTFARKLMTRNGKKCFGFPQPEIHLWKDSIPADCNVLLLDEGA